VTTVRAACVRAAVPAALGLACLLALAVPATAQPSREQALEDLRDQGHPDARRRGTQVLAETGTMADVPALASALRDSDPVVRALAERAMWQVWSRSGDDETDRLFALGVEQMSEGQGPAAVETFTRVIERRPDFAEGWNKRATVYYLMGEHQKSLADCDEVMKRNPYHFGALSGYGMIYLQLGEPEKALGYFERALAVNPNLTAVGEAVQGLRRLLLERRRDTTRAPAPPDRRTS
jgi:tetratricopeptide (TPR) repeat protein